MDPSAQAFRGELYGLPYDKKWGLLRPQIEQLYVAEGRKLSEVIAEIDRRWGFKATESQYKYQIKKWGLKRSTPQTKKEAVYRIVKSRAQTGKSSMIRKQGRDFDTKNFVRYVKSQHKSEFLLRPSRFGLQEERGWPSPTLSHLCGPRIFMNWNMPYGVSKSFQPVAGDHPSPLSDIIVTTPSSQDGPPSPLAQVIKSISITEMSRLFLEGKHNKLLQSVTQTERTTMSTWMYQFWLFSFKTAKHWGRGPQEWTADLLGFNDHKIRKMVTSSSPSTPSGHDVAEISQHTSSMDSNSGFDRLDEQRPTSLCRWAIHCRNVDYEEIPDSPQAPGEPFDLDDEANWPSWSADQSSQELTEKLVDGIQTASFSSVEKKDLPIDTIQVASAARRTPEEMLYESIGFSIMGRNTELLESLLEKKPDLEASGLFPFHLAASYLDGAKACCSIMNYLPINQKSPQKSYINDLGHTILDQIMISILKSHTSCIPGTVDEAFRSTRQFAGEDVDICGRWDADSPCIRILRGQGNPRIPFEWKHMFCHTSAQAVCHCISFICRIFRSVAKDSPSGLFVRRCSKCGLKLELYPLHALLFIAFHLSVSGCPGEDLFGILACLLCLLDQGVDLHMTANVSLLALLKDEESPQCLHQKYSPYQLAEELQYYLPLNSTKEIKVGWTVIYCVLRCAQKADEDGLTHPEVDSDDCPSSDEEIQASGRDPMSAQSGFYSLEECDMCCDLGNDWWSNELGQLWAAVQTELLTYRRLEESDPWTSPHFDVKALSEDLANGHKLRLGLLQDSMVKPFCRCGTISETPFLYLTVQDVSAYHFSNMDDWNRSTFLKTPEFF